MTEPKEEIIVGILGQWASGKTAAARALIGYLGGADKVVFINDQELIAGQSIKHIQELEDSEVTLSIEDDGTRRMDGGQVTVWLGPDEDFETVDLYTLLFACTDELFQVWLNRARAGLGPRICERSAEGKPIVIEAGFGTDTQPAGEKPFSHTISDLFAILEEAGVEPGMVKWIIVEAAYDTRSERNAQRPVGVPVDKFDRYAADGGDLDPGDQRSWEEQGTTIRRVDNNHDDIERFRADIIAAFETMYQGKVSA